MRTEVLFQFGAIKIRRSKQTQTGGIMNARSNAAEKIISNEGILLRRFDSEESDEKQMRDLVWDNAFLGEPFDTICSAKGFFGDVVLRPYIKYQPENIHVAIDSASGKLVGYLTGSMGGAQFERAQYEMVKGRVKSLAVSLAMPWNFFDTATRSFAAHIIFRGESERPAHPEGGAHWHFQIDKDFRGKGIGTKLLRQFIADVIKSDLSLLWGEVMVYPEKPRGYFEDRGWGIHDVKPTGIFGDHVDFPVEIMCITKRIGV